MAGRPVWTHTGQQGTRHGEHMNTGTDRRDELFLLWQRLQVIHGI